MTLLTGGSETKSHCDFADRTLRKPTLLASTFFPFPAYAYWTVWIPEKLGTHVRLMGPNEGPENINLAYFHPQTFNFQHNS